MMLLHDSMNFEALLAKFALAKCVLSNLDCCLGHYGSKLGLTSRTAVR
jgi:hypothetical protein